MLNALREQLMPRSTMCVYDAVSDARIDVSDWHNVSSNIKPAQNPGRKSLPHTCPPLSGFWQYEQGNFGPLDREGKVENGSIGDY